jgi:hypothetical protein
MSFPSWAKIMLFFVALQIWGGYLDGFCISSPESKVEHILLLGDRGFGERDYVPNLGTGGHTDGDFPDP